MQSETHQIIDNLKNSDLYAECSCGDEFKLSDLILFDGTKPFPKEALESKQAFLDELKDREEDLEKQLREIEKPTHYTFKGTLVSVRLLV